MNERQKCFMNLHLTPEQYGLWQLCYPLYLKQGVLYFSGRKIASMFKATGKDAIYRLRDELADLGVFRLVKAPTKRRNGTYSPAEYKVLSHDELAAEQPGQCLPVGKSRQAPVENSRQAAVTSLEIQTGTCLEIQTKAYTYTDTEEEEEERTKCAGRSVSENQPQNPAVAQSAETGDAQSAPDSPRKQYARLLTQNARQQLKVKLDDDRRAKWEQLFEELMEQHPGITAHEIDDTFQWARTDEFWRSKVAGISGVETFVQFFDKEIYPRYQESKDSTQAPTVDDNSNPATRRFAEKFSQILGITVTPGRFDAAIRTYGEAELLGALEFAANDKFWGNKLSPQMFVAKLDTIIGQHRASKRKIASTSPFMKAESVKPNGAFRYEGEIL